MSDKPDSQRQAVLRGTVQAQRAGGICLRRREEVERYGRERIKGRGRKPASPRHARHPVEG